MTKDKQKCFKQAIRTHCGGFVATLAKIAKKIGAFLSSFRGFFWPT
jgi:hypothetical protein